MQSYASILNVRAAGSRYASQYDRAWEYEERSPGEFWPSSRLPAEKDFGRLQARLFCYIGRKMRTPSGPGTLVQAFRDRATVLLDSELERCAIFHPAEIEPISWEL